MAVADRSPVHVALLIDAARREGVSGGDRYDAELVSAAPANGCSVRMVRCRRSQATLALPRADVVVIDSLVAWRSAAAVRRRRRPPTVALVHQRPGGTDGPWLVRAVRARLDVSTYRACDAVVATGRTLADDLRRRGLGDVVVIEPGCDLPTAEPAAPLRGRRRLGLVCVANWLPNKGIVDLLAAVERLPPDQVSLHLVGRPDADPVYERLVRSHMGRASMRDRVTVHGTVPPARVASLVAAADALAFPSRVEAYGMAVAESLALGVPVIGWRTPHMEALVTHGEDGLLAEPFDVGSLAGAIGSLARDDALRSRLAAGARRTGASLPRWPTTTARFFDLVQHAQATALPRRG